MKTGNESGKQKRVSSKPQFQKSKWQVPSSGSVPTPRNRAEYKDQNLPNFRLDQNNLKVVWQNEVVGFLHVVNVVEPTLVDVVMA